MPTYFQILTAIISFAVSHPDAFRKLWDLIVASYKASVDLINGVKAELPGAEIPPEAVPTAGTLSLMEGHSTGTIVGTVHNMTPDELDAEDRLEQLIAPGGSLALKLGGGGSLRKIIMWLQTSPVGAALLAELLKRLGS